MAELDTPESWTEARNIASRIGAVPSSLTTCLRYIRTDHEQKAPKLTKTARYCLLRLTKSASFKAPLYYAALTYCPEKLPQDQFLTDSELIDMFDPGELLVILAIEYMYRRIKKMADPEEWNFVHAPLQSQVDIGGLVGRSIPAVSPMLGILSGAMPLIGTAMFLVADKNGFVKYRRTLKLKGMTTDPNLEIESWGCTHLQVGSLLCQPLGLGPQLGAAVARGLYPHLQSDNPLPQEILSMRAARIWIDALIKTSKAPSIGMPAQFYPPKSALEKLIAAAQANSASGSAHRWLDRSKEDVTPDLTPSLFAGGKDLIQEAEEPTPDDLAAEVLSQISEEELKKLEE